MGIKLKSSLIATVVSLVFAVILAGMMRCVRWEEMIAAEVISISKLYISLVVCGVCFWFIIRSAILVDYNDAEYWRQCRGEWGNTESYSVTQVIIS